MSNWAIIPSDSDIMHRSHKYIEKVRTTKGGWRYIYKRPKYESRNKKKNLGINELKNLKKLEKATDEAQRKKDWALKTGRLDGYDEDSKRRYEKANERAKNAKNEELRALEKWRATTLGSIASSAKAGAEIISDFIKTFPQMASMKLSYILNGSPYNTKIPFKATDRWKNGTSYNPSSVHNNPLNIPRSFTKDIDSFMSDYNKKNGTNYNRKTSNVSISDLNPIIKPDKEKLNYYKNLKFKNRR